MTTREFLNAVINSDPTAIEEAQKRLTAMDEKSAQDRASKDAENAPFIEAIQSVLTDKPQTASQIAAAVNISTPKATALLKKMSVKVGEMTVDKRIVKAYSL